MARGPLADVRILDLTHVWAGPLATRILSDLGAEIIKVEAPMGRGPRNYPSQPIGGFIGKKQGPTPYNTNAAFVKLQRNKKSLALDLKQVKGREIFLELVAQVDVVIENFSSEVMSNLGLDFPTLRKANPRVIHFAMPGYGLNGPYKDRVAFGPTVEPMSGLTQIMGYSEQEPRSTAMALPDAVAALHAVAGVVAALNEREDSGQGRLVEMSLFEAAVASHGPWIAESQLSGEDLNRIGNRHPRMAPHGVYPCAGNDQWVAIACRGDSDWTNLCGILNAESQRHWALGQRQKQYKEIDHTISTWTSNRFINEIVDELQSNGIPSGQVRATPEMLLDDQIQHRGFFVPLERDTPMPGNPIKMKGISSDDWTPCPTLGNDNHAILSQWLGLSESQIADLYSRGTIVDKPPL